jgi:DNA adenine methylase
MQYMGGKARIAKKIAEYLKTLRQPGQLFLEPFCGAVNITCEMNDGTGPVRACDAHPDLIRLWTAVQRGWRPRHPINRKLYQRLLHSRPSAIRAYVGFGFGFGGRFFSGFADRDCNRQWAVSSLRRKRPRIAGVRFERREYHTLRPRGALIYCDPPYAGTKGFSVGPFDHERFWETMRRWSRCNTVIISETSAPTDFIPVLEIIAPGCIRFADGTRRPRREFLFALRPPSSVLPRLTSAR